MSSGKKTRNDRGLCPIKGEWSGFCSWTGAQNQLLGLSLCTTGITPHYKMPVIHLAFNLTFDILPRDPRGWLRSNKPQSNRPSRTCRQSHLLEHPAYPGTRYSPTVCRVEISFNAFWHCRTNGDVRQGGCFGAEISLLSLPRLEPEIVQPVARSLHYAILTNIRSQWIKVISILLRFVSSSKWHYVTW